MSYVNPVPYLTMSPLLAELNTIRGNLEKLRYKIQSSTNLQDATSPLSNSKQKPEKEQSKIACQPSEILQFILQMSSNQPNQQQGIDNGFADEKKHNEKSDEILESILSVMTPSVTEDIVKNCKAKIYSLQKRQQELENEIKEKCRVLEQKKIQNSKLLNILELKKRIQEPIKEEYRHEKLLNNVMYK